MILEASPNHAWYILYSHMTHIILSNLIGFGNVFTLA